MDKREIRQMMQLLQIEDVTTKRQLKNGTITWKLPIKIGSGNRNIEVGSFKSGYVRNNNCGYSNYQLNKRCENEPEYFQLNNGDYRKFSTRGCILIPNELDRLEYLIKYCVKNYYIKHANFVADGEYVAKWTHEHAMNGLQNKLANSVPKWKYDEAMNLGKEQDCGHYDRIKDLESDVHTQRQRGDGYKEGYEQQKMIACGFKNEIKELENKLQSIIRTARH